MNIPRLSKLELEIMEQLWTRGNLSIREIQEHMTGDPEPAYTTVQTMVYRLEEKGVLKRQRKIGNAHIFAATVDKHEVRGKLLDELLALFGGKPQLVMSHLVETGKLTLEDVESAQSLLTQRKKGGKR
jgi:BlaI family transcriptional regulator, penicillinase repressor